MSVENGEYGMFEYAQIKVRGLMIYMSTEVSNASLQCG